MTHRLREQARSDQCLGTSSRLTSLWLGEQARSNW